MKNTFLHLPIALLTLVAGVACDNPADGKAKAKVSEAKPEAPATKAAATRTYLIGPEHGSIILRGSKPSRTHSIGVGAWKGTIAIPDGNAAAATIRVELDMTTVQADDDNLTKHLKSPDFFEVARFPTATFVSTGVVAGGDKGATHTVTGNLELRGVKKSISFPASVTVGAGGVSAKAEFVIDRKDFGIVYPGMADDLIRDEVVIQLNLSAPPVS
jgi:polyisoprenoid-binding protein YceI